MSIQSGGRAKAISPLATEDAVVLPPSSGAAILLWGPDQQVIGYREMKRMAPAHVVQTASGVRTLPMAANAISPQWTWGSQALNVESYMDAMRASGVIVLKDGQVLLEQYGLGRTQQDLWYSQSVTKSVTAILAGAAIKDGHIKSIETPATDHIPELKGSSYEDVTLRHLLSMTSGVKWSEDYTDARSLGSSDVFCLWSLAPEPGIDPVVSYARRLPRVACPGAKFEYNTADTHLAGILISNAVGRSLAEYLSEKIWRPYGMEAEAFWTVDSAGYEYAGGGLSMRLRDYARIGQFMLDGGHAGEDKVLASDWLAEATSCQVDFTPGSRTDGRSGYGYYWWIYPDSYAARGYAGQAIFVYPKDKVVIAINSAWLNNNQPHRPDYVQAELRFVQTLHAAAVAHS